MERGHRLSGATEGRGDLDQAARVAASIHIRSCSKHVPRLAISELPRRLGLEEVVDAGRSAADCLLGRFQTFESGDPVQQCARGIANRLSMQQMARVLERNTQRQRPPPGAGLALYEQLGDVDDRNVETRVLEM